MKQIAAVELERCVALANLLETVPPEAFTLKSWISQPPMEKRNWIGIKASCGFAGCAMGWAAHEKLFPGFAIGDNNVAYQRTDACRLISWDAVRAVMGLSLGMSRYLFAPDGYPNGYKTTPTAAIVADRVRRFANKIAAIRARDHRKVAAPVSVQRKLELVAA